MASPLLEDQLPGVLQGGANTNKTMTIGGSANIDASGSSGVIKLPTGGMTTPGGTTLTKIPGSVAVQTNGTTQVNVFGATNGFGGTITSVMVYGINASVGTISIAGSNGTVAAVLTNAPATIGLVIGGSLTTAATPFTSGGTLTVSATGSAQGILFATYTTA